MHEVCTPSATSAAVIEELRVLFAQFGQPDTIVTDNGTCFVSAEFAAYLKKNGIKHITSAPYHPATNGMAERAVQIVKRGLKKITQGSIRTRPQSLSINTAFDNRNVSGRDATRTPS